MNAFPVVIKLGGSLASSPSHHLEGRLHGKGETSPPPGGEGAEVGGAASSEVTPEGEGSKASLARWLSIIAAAERPAVLVPGGGAFADTVRDEQRRLGFSDEAAHFMAILAMHQTGTMLLDMQPGRLTAAATEAELRGALGRGEVPVWMALSMAVADPHLPRDWSLTSDGLAAWLALQLRIPEVWLVKSITVAADAALPSLAEQGVVDAVFAGIVARAGLSWRIFGPGEEDALGAALTATGIAAHV